MKWNQTIEHRGRTFVVDARRSVNEWDGSVWYYPVVNGHVNRGRPCQRASIARKLAVASVLSL